MPHHAQRTARIKARIAPDTLAIVRRAAELQGRRVSDFVIAAAEEAANRIVEQTHIFRLSVQDQRAFAALILNPPGTAASLVQAAKAHRRLINQNPQCLVHSALGDVG